LHNTLIRALVVCSCYISYRYCASIAMPMYDLMECFMLLVRLIFNDPQMI